MTDDKDKRLITSILKLYITMETVSDPDYKFSKSGLYYAPNYETVHEYVEYIR